MKKPVIVLSATVLAVVIIAAWLWRELRTAREQLAALQTRVNELQAAQGLTRVVPAPLPVPRLSETPGAVGSPETPAIPGPAARPMEPGRVVIAGGGMQTIDSPEGREMARSAIRTLLEQQYQDLGKELNLSAAELDALLDAMARQQVDGLGRMLGPDGQPLDPAARLQQLQERQKANQAEIAAMLGNNSYAQFQQYQESLPSRQQVNQLRTMLGTGSNALTDSQAQFLVTALAAEQKRINEQPRNPEPAGTGLPERIAEQQRLTAENNRRLVEVAATQLNSQQLDSYKKVLDQQSNTRLFMNMPGGGGIAVGIIGAPAGVPPGR